MLIGSINQLSQALSGGGQPLKRIPYSEDDSEEHIFVPLAHSKPAIQPYFFLLLLV